MIYRLKLLGFFFNKDKHLFQLKKTEKVMGIQKIAFLLVLLWLFIYGWIGWIGMGAEILSVDASGLTSVEYELRKFWFMLGRLVYALLFALFLLFVPTVLFSFLFQIPVAKTVSLQLGVLLILILERLTWIPLFIYEGLEWHLSPFSLGIAASLLTDLEPIIYFFGAVSLFHIWIIAFQASSLIYLSTRKKRWIWLTVISVHFMYLIGIAALATYDHYLVSLL